MDKQIALVTGASRGIGKAILHALGEDEFAKAVGKFQAVQLNMFYTNRLFMPTYNGPQCGNPDMVEQLALKTAEITGAKVAERGSDEDD